ncbi:MAG: hypothetical protein WAV28_15480 [Sedimentisphaerales bacterium]
MICVDCYPHGAEHILGDVMLGLERQATVSFDVVCLYWCGFVSAGLPDIRDDIQ